MCFDSLELIIFVVAPVGPPRLKHRVVRRLDRLKPKHQYRATSWYHQGHGAQLNSSARSHPLKATAQQPPPRKSTVNQATAEKLHQQHRSPARCAAAPAFPRPPCKSYGAQRRSSVRRAASTVASAAQKSPPLTAAAQQPPPPRPRSSGSAAAPRPPRSSPFRRAVVPSAAQLSPPAVQKPRPPLPSALPTAQLPPPAAQHHPPAACSLCPAKALSTKP